MWGILMKKVRVKADMMRTPPISKLPSEWLYINRPVSDAKVSGSQLTQSDGSWLVARFS